MDNPLIDAEGNKWWRDADGSRHRDDDPAVIYADGYKSWHQHGEYHRDDGPAVMFANGYKEWWLHGQELTLDDWLQINPELTDEEKVMFKLQYG